MDPAVHAVLRLLLTAILVLALVAKLRGYERFREVLARYEVLPVALTGVASTVVVCWEAAAAVGLWVWPHAGAALAAVLFGTYALAISANLLRGRTHIDCGCEWGGGATTSSDRLTPWLPIRNAGLVLAALTLLVPASPRPLAFVDYGLIGAAATFFVVAFLVMDRAVRQWLALAGAFAAAGRTTDA